MADLLCVAACIPAPRRDHIRRHDVVGQAVLGREFASHFAHRGGKRVADHVGGAASMSRKVSMP